MRGKTEATMEVQLEFDFMNEEKDKPEVRPPDPGDLFFSDDVDPNHR